MVFDTSGIKKHSIQSPCQHRRLGVNLHSCDTGMFHYFGYFFWVDPGFLGTFLGYSRIFGYHFFGKI